jgi:hypothetical protein
VHTLPYASFAHSRSGRSVLNMSEALASKWQKKKPLFEHESRQLSEGTGTLPALLSVLGSLVSKTSKTFPRSYCIPYKPPVRGRLCAWLETLRLIAVCRQFSLSKYWTVTRKKHCFFDHNDYCLLNGFEMTSQYVKLDPCIAGAAHWFQVLETKEESYLCGITSFWGEGSMFDAWAP